MEVLEGKTAVVTGGGSGIGRGLAVRLGGEGMRVVVADIREDAAAAVAEEIAAQGGETRAVACDVSDRSSVAALADECFATFGAVDVLCNNAGVTSFTPLVEMTDDEWDWVIGVDFLGVVYGFQAFVPRMVRQGTGGHIVNTSSLAGLLPGFIENHVAYTAAKGGVLALSVNAREELASEGIGVSVLMPGMVRTEIWASARARPTRFGGPGADVIPTAAGGSAVGSAADAHDQGEGSTTEDMLTALDPLTVGAMVVSAIRENRAYIHTHVAALPYFREQCAEVERAFEGMR